MIESASGISSYCFLDFSPFTIAILIGKANQNDVTFFGEILGFLSSINDHFINWTLISHNLTSNNLRSLTFERQNFLSFLHIFLDLFRIS
jgi:hypothetical protein